MVHYIDSAPLALRQRIISQNNIIIMHPMDIYCARPSILGDILFHEYHRNYETTDRVRHNHIIVGVNMLGHAVVVRNE